MKEFIDRVRETEENVVRTVEAIDELTAKLELQREQVERDFRRITERLRLSRFDPEKVDEFWEQPYAVVPRRPDEWYVIAPTFVDFQIGWLEKTVRGWNYFVVNKYINWLAQVPKELREKFRFREPLPLKVSGGKLLTGEKHQEEAWSRYKKHLRQREGKDKIALKGGHEFTLIADMISDGILPFMPTPLKASDTRGAELAFQLRDYQQDAWEKFRKFGAVGVYWPFGAGKTFIGLHALAHVKGPKLVVVPTSTLREQWAERIAEHVPNGDEVEIATYHSYEKLQNREFKLVIFDECHRLPANTFSRLATLKTDYRMGLSATPYREDGRTDLIFALTGFPVGMDWKHLLDAGIVGKPTVTLYIVPSYEAKERKIEELLRDDKKTLIYSYWLEPGKKLANRLGLPFVYGDTTNRLEVFRNSPVFVVSSVGGEGLSLPDLERTIEFSFLYGSRKEEGQLMGRTFHSTKGDPEHVILMTDDEMERYEKRLYAIFEKGFRINIVR